MVADPSSAQERKSAPVAAIGWVVDAPAAKKLIDGGDVTVLDTRGRWAFARGHVSGAVRVDWTDFSQSDDPNRGKLEGKAELQKKIRALGVRADRPVLVVGDPPDDWGEDGRIVWMLRSAGHKRAGLVNGGIEALERSGVDLTMRRASPEPGNFELKWDPAFSITRDALRANRVALVIDTREKREYEGATPYGESRGGHVSAAKNLHFKELLQPDGTLRSAREIRAAITRLGGAEQTPIVAYCTGGVRSGWMVAVLRSVGFSDVRNYAGSMWDWSAAPAAEFPLVAR